MARTVKRTVKKHKSPEERRVVKSQRRTVKARQVDSSVKKKDKHLRAVPLGSGVPPIPNMVDELLDMKDVLMGRVEPPIDAGFLTLYEVADAYFARAAELTMELQRLEREGSILRGSAHYKFRTGELRTFMELCKRAADLGSRRITYEQLRYEMEMTGRESV